MSAKPEPRVVDAYTQPRKIHEGCMHQLGCKCDPPYWLRLPTPAEEARWPVNQKPQERA
jgi:hypothetical protein